MTSSIPAIDGEAARWAVRLSARALKADEQAELDAWLEADIRHRGALIRAQAAWVDLDRAAALAPREASHEPVPPPRREGSRETRRWFLAASVAGLAFTGAGAGGLWWWRRRGEIYETQVGEIRRVTLPDGSSLLLNTATRAVAHFSDRRREVELERGEALFEVAKDRNRPFVVRARDVSVRAVGTVFTVRAVDQNVAVTVTEGVVEVADIDPGSAAVPQKVTADEQAVISGTAGIRVQRVSEVQVERHLAWRDGMLSFDGEPLSDAVKEINRHNTRRIAIDDPALAQRPVVGLFRASDMEGFADTVAAALGADKAADGDTIHLQSRSAR